MTKSLTLTQRKSLAKKAFQKLFTALSLENRWRVSLVLDSLPENTFGTCECNPRYHRARITIDISKEAHKDPIELVDTIRHELIHVLLGQMDPVLRGPSGRQADAIETTVAALEITLDGLGLTVDRFI